MSQTTDESLFAGITFEKVEVLGRSFTVPIRYFDVSRISAAFPANAAKIQGLLPSPKLKPVQPKPGVAVVGIGAWEYGRIDGLAPYNELAIVVPVLYEGTGGAPGLPGFYVLHLPVTTEDARLLGVEVWGFPKFIAQITVEDAGEALRCRLSAEGSEIATLEVKKLLPESQFGDLYTYTVKDGQLLRTLIAFKGQLATSRVPGGASYSLGEHPIAERLRALEIGTVSLEHTYAPRLQTMLHLPSERLPL